MTHIDPINMKRRTHTVYTYDTVQSHAAPPWRDDGTEPQSPRQQSGDGDMRLSNIGLLGNSNKIRLYSKDRM